MPVMALGTPGGDNQDQTILQAFLSVVEFWNDWYPNLHAAFERPRVQTGHFLRIVLAAQAGLQQLAVEADVPETVYNELKARGHDVQPPAALRNVGLCHGRNDRSGHRQPIRRGRPAAGLLRHCLLARVSRSRYFPSIHA